MTDHPIALITGGAQGIGLACAEALIENGARAVLADIQDKVTDVAANLPGALVSLGGSTLIDLPTVIVAPSVSARAKGSEGSFTASGRYASGPHAPGVGMLNAAQMIFAPPLRVEMSWPTV